MNCANSDEYACANARKLHCRDEVTAWQRQSILYCVAVLALHNGIPSASRGSALPDRFDALMLLTLCGP
jgi:hypothetical protein